MTTQSLPYNKEQLLQVLQMAAIATHWNTISTSAYEDKQISVTVTHDAKVEIVLSDGTLVVKAHLNAERVYVFRPGEWMEYLKDVAAKNFAPI